MKLKQKAKDLSKQAALYCGSRHRQRRLYIQCELRTLVDLSKDVPGLLAPKFPMVLAALSFARAELLWVLMHKGQMPPKHRMKHLPEGHCDDQMSEKHCKRTYAKGRPCKWCKLDPKIGFCQPWTEGCLLDLNS